VSVIAEDTTGTNSVSTFQPPKAKRQHSFSSEPYMDEDLPASAFADGKNPYFVPQLKRQHSSGRNDPCPCGSGKKFKNCHWRQRKSS